MHVCPVQYTIHWTSAERYSIPSTPVYCIEMRQMASCSVYCTSLTCRDMRIDGDLFSLTVPCTLTEIWGRWWVVQFTCTLHFCRDMRQMVSCSVYWTNTLHSFRDMRQIASNIMPPINSFVQYSIPCTPAETYVADDEQHDGPQLASQLILLFSTLHSWSDMRQIANNMMAPS
jgi:hypothetical protein